MLWPYFLHAWTLVVIWKSKCYMNSVNQHATRTQWIGPEKKSPPKNQKLVLFAWVRWFVPGRYVTRQNQTSLPPFVLGDGTGQHQGLPLLSDPIPSFVGMAASQESHWRRLQTSEQKCLNAGRTATFCLKVCFESSLTESHWCESSEWGSAPIVPTWVVLWPQNPQGYFVSLFWCRHYQAQLSSFCFWRGLEGERRGWWLLTRALPSQIPFWPERFQPQCSPHAEHRLRAVIILLAPGGAAPSQYCYPDRHLPAKGPGSSAPLFFWSACLTVSRSLMFLDLLSFLVSHVVNVTNC